jgi:hypothetical protein
MPNLAGRAASARVPSVDMTMAARPGLFRRAEAPAWAAEVMAAVVGLTGAEADLTAVAGAISRVFVMVFSL